MTAPTLEAERAAPGNYLDWWTSIETDVRKSMLVWAHREPERLHALVKQAYEAGQESQMARIKHLTHERDLALRLARTAAPVAEGVALPPLDAEGLPPLPIHDWQDESAIPRTGGYQFWLYDSVRQAQRDAYELGKRASIDGQLTGAPSPVKQSIDTTEFRELLQELWMCMGSTKMNKIAAKIIAYIDGRTAGTAPADPFAGQRFLNWNRSQEKPPVAIGKELGVARKVLEFAAAPSPLPPKEGA